ncbi:restriction endonuclease subunit S [Comamonas thiooxydans]|uniref:restriction endonuclease subunit S n=1 Tax=Comamonas thiooxydans TaxID=363952 RepID=UPI00209C65CC|nr:restriction endonuclease subunit S [Comamonas thiooxydans]MCO8250752.1 restriction endonuclease subunit S [Comamonas thiooxydans]
MSSDVSEHTLESLCLLVADCPHATPKWTDSGVIVLRNQNIKEGRLDLSSPSFTDEAHYLGRIRRAEPQQGDIVITREAPMGDVCQIPAGLKCCLGQRQVLLRPNPAKIDSRFLLYALQSPYVQHQIGWNEGTGSTVSNLRIPVLEALRVPTPSLESQREIATTLGVLDDRITLLRETNATLEAIAQALFKSWFVDFDPVRAKMEGRTPEGMDEATAALFPDGFESSELGAVPRGWRWESLANAFDFNPSRSLKKGVVASYLDMASLSTSGHCADSPVPRGMGSGSKFRNGDTLLARITPCLENGKSAFVDFLSDDEIAWGSTEFLVLRPKAPLPEYFAYLLCRHPAFRDYAIRSMSGTSGRQRIQNDVLGRYLLAVGPSEVALAFGDIVAPVQKAIAANHQVTQTLSTLRDTLLPRLISGQLRLPEAQAELKEALA